MFFKTAFNGYSIKFSPFEDGKLAVATAQNFGIIGNGRQYVIQVHTLSNGCVECASLTAKQPAMPSQMLMPSFPGGRVAAHEPQQSVPAGAALSAELPWFHHPQATPQGFRPVAEFDTKDGVYDCAWSEVLWQSLGVSQLRLTAYASSKKK